MVIIKTVNLTKIYKQNFNYIRALTNCNLEIEQGEFVAISGARGSGKSTLLHMLGGYDRPSSGKVYIDRRDIYSLSQSELAAIYRQEIGFIFQDFQLISGLTVYENIVMPSLLNLYKNNEAYTTELIYRLRIADILNKYPKQLTEEQKQCVVIARALINQPEIILADEPTRCLYELMRKEVLDLLLEYVNDYRRTLIMVTNDSQISLFADLNIRLDQGFVIESRYRGKSKTL